ncbi:protein kinase, partial [Myxococcota bacterium]|nr:protein kinase [Myxococcota bacterium]
MRKIGPYVLSSRIASGTLGDVFLARRDAPGADGDDGVAVKVLRAELARDLRFLRLLFAEAPAAVRFDHPAAVRTLEIERDGADVYVAMELERGQPLSSVLKRAQIAGEPIEHRLVAWIGAEIASVLRRAHDTPWFSGAPVGMIHGALSPRGVLVTYDGRIKVLGVGVGRARLSLAPASARLPYCAPELLLEREPTPRVDTYALGVLVHDALTGKHAFRRATDDETKAAIREGRIPPLSPLALRLPAAVGELVQRMIVPKVEARAADLVEIEVTLRDAAAGDDVELTGALERRMRAIFAGEIRAERRVVQAAQRQPRGASILGGAAFSSGVAPIASAAGPATSGAPLTALPRPTSLAPRPALDLDSAATLSDTPLAALADELRVRELATPRAGSLRPAPALSAVPVSALSMEGADPDAIAHLPADAPLGASPRETSL